MRALEVIDRLESAIGKPVITSNQALMRSARVRLRIEVERGTEHSRMRSTGAGRSETTL
jgi:maleate cis-trans isomerase